MAVKSALDDLRQLVHAAESEKGIGLMESFEHFDRRGQVALLMPATVTMIPPSVLLLAQVEREAHKGFWDPTHLSDVKHAFSAYT